MSIFSNFFNKSPKTLPELIEKNYEELVQLALKKEKSDAMLAGMIVLSVVGNATEEYKKAYGEDHKKLGYTRNEYEKLVDSICTKIINKYIE
jgi:hypothetical protein